MACHTPNDLCDLTPFSSHSLIFATFILHLHWTISSTRLFLIPKFSPMPCTLLDSPHPNSCHSASFYSLFRSHYLFIKAFSGYWTRLWVHSFVHLLYHSIYYTVEPPLSNVIRFTRLFEKRFFENWISFVCHLRHVCLTIQVSVCKGCWAENPRTEDLFDNWEISSMNNLVKNWIVWDGGCSRTEVSLHFKTSFLRTNSHIIKLIYSK